MLLLFVISILLVSTKSTAVERKHSALQFGTTAYDYIQFSYSMTPFRNSLTLCTWIKRVYTSSSQPVVFHYQTSSSRHEILTAANGVYNRVVGDMVLENSHSKFTTPVGQWFHYCLTWSSSTRTIQLYLDGELAATGQTSSGNWRALHTSGTVWFNRLGNSASSSRIFGGQIHQFNMYSEVLTSESIKRIADGGLCFDLKEFSGTRILRWEDILAKSRTGSVTEVTGCDLGKELEMMREKMEKMSEQLDTVTGQLNRTKDDLETVTGQLNSTQDELEAITVRLNRTEDNLETVSGHLNSTQDDLQTATGRLNRTEGQLETSSSALTDTKSQLDGSRKFQNVTQWDILYTAPYYNNVLTEELVQQLKSSWDLLTEFVGVNVTESVVDHFRKHDVDKAECGAQSDVLDMLDELVGDKMMMTSGIIQHFRENHNDVPCDD